MIQNQVRKSHDKSGQYDDTLKPHYDFLQAITEQISFTSLCLYLFSLHPFCLFNFVPF